MIAGLMPRDVNLTVGIDPSAFADKFAQAAELLGVEVDPVKPPRPMRVIERAKVIEHGN